MRTNPRPPARFEDGIRVLRAYVKARGHSRVKVGYVDPSGFHLYNWLRVQRAQLAGGRLSAARVQALRSLGVVGLVLDEMYARHLALLAALKEATGDADVPAAFELEGYALGRWLAQAKYRARRGKVPRRWVEELRALGIKIASKKKPAPSRPLMRDPRFGQGIASLKRFLEESGHVRVPQASTYQGFALGSWLHHQRLKMREGRLPPDDAAKLMALGVEPRGRRRTHS